MNLNLWNIQTWQCYIYVMHIKSNIFMCLVKWSNACPHALKFVKWKVGASDNWYLLIVNVFKMFDFDMWWLY